MNEPPILQLRPTAHRVLAKQRLVIAHRDRRVAIAPYGEVETWLLQLLAAGINAGELETLTRRRWGTAGENRIQELLPMLVDAGLVRQLDPRPSVPQRFERTLTYLSQFAGSEGGEHELFARIRDSVVLVAGVGGLGSWLSAGLVGLGVGELRLADFDEVEASNLNRTLLLQEGDVKRSKLAATQERLRALSSHTTVRTFTHDLSSGALPTAAVDGLDVMICTADKPAWVIRRIVAECCVRRGIRFICPSGFRVGPFYLGPGTACAMCEYAEMLDKQPGLQSIFEDQQRVPPSQPGSVPHIAAASAAVTLQETLRVLTGVGKPATRNQIWMADQNLAAKFVARPRYDRCSTCG